MKTFLTKLLLIIPILILTLPEGKVKCNDDLQKEKTKKIVYLTFDDGPGGDVTTKTLDILKEEQVPATFFIIGQQVKGQEDLILRMKNEGHAIGLHSFTHERCNLYSSSSCFVSEMKKAQQALYDVTGEYYYIIRFPFGSNNSTYRLTQGMVDAVHSNNFKIYDWTQDTLDGANPGSSPDTILNRAISTKDTVVVLMHNTVRHKNTYQALRGIIKYYKSQGYTFEKITVETPEIYHILKR